MTHNLAQPDFRSPDFLREHIRHTLSFYEGRALDPSGGFFHCFKGDGTVYDTHTRHLVSSTRFVFNHAMAYRAFGRLQDQAAARHGLDFLHTAHAQTQGGYAWVINWRDGRAKVVDGTNHCYGLAFVLLAHAHALMAGVSGAEDGLRATFDLMEARFWEPDHGLYADEATPGWQVGPYRGQNANMHACEAMLAAHEATGEPLFLARALELADGVTQHLASQSKGLVWEHYHANWHADWDYNRHDRSNIFRPWGFQVGHLTEWAKLLLQLEARLGPVLSPAWLLPTARHLFDTAMRRGWDMHHGGLFYGFGLEGEVCDDHKYFWVQAESMAAAAWLGTRTGMPHYWDWYERIWAYSWTHFVDHQHGAWWRILTASNQHLSDEKSPPGKTDYHIMGACHDVLKALAPMG